MMFDPEKIERFDSDLVHDSDGGWVQASDYDQLLDIHLRHVRMIAELFIKCGEPLSEEKIASLKNGTWR